MKSNRTRKAQHPCACHKIPHDSIEPASQACLRGERPTTADVETGTFERPAIARCSETGIEWKIIGYSERPGSATWEYQLTASGLDRALVLARDGTIYASPSELAREARALGRVELANQLLNEAIENRPTDDVDARMARLVLAGQLGEDRRWRDLPGLEGGPRDVGGLRFWLLGRLDRLDLEGVPERAIAEIRIDPWWGYLDAAGLRIPSSEPQASLFLAHAFYYVGRVREGCDALRAFSIEKRVAVRLPFVWAVLCALLGVPVDEAIALVLERAELFAGLEQAGHETDQPARLRRHFVLEVRNEYLALADREIWIATGNVIAALSNTPLRQCLDEMYDWHPCGKLSGRETFLESLGVG